jgi:hypothetical protein
MAEIRNVNIDKEFIIKFGVCKTDFLDDRLSTALEELPKAIEEALKESIVDGEITVAPVKHGHFRRLTFSGDTIICSECKMAYNIFETNGAENFNFCPHCGAKIMDGGEGE